MSETCEVMDRIVCVKREHVRCRGGGANSARAHLRAAVDGGLGSEGAGRLAKFGAGAEGLVRIVFIVHTQSCSQFETHVPLG